MGNGCKASCVLCQRSEETKITGALSTKEQVTAHQDCLLYASGLYSTESPEYDDLFGFSVEDVIDEAKRGSRLICYHCKKKGATVGCELKRCKKSFHYPCAVLGGAVPFEDRKNGKYGVYCLNHHEQKNGDSVNNIKKPQPSESLNESRPPKAYCLACEKAEGNISLESLSNSIVMLYCDKHAPSSHKRKIDSNGAGPSSCISTSSSSTHCSSKRQLTFNGEEDDELPIKQKYKRTRTISEDSLNSDVECLIPPIESDMDESVNFHPEHQPTVPPQLSQEPERPSVCRTENEPVNDNVDVINEVDIICDNEVFTDEDDATMYSDAESESLLLPVIHHIVMPPHLSTPPAAQLQTISVQVQTIKKEYGGLSPSQSPAHSPEQDASGPVPQQNCTAPPSPPSPPSPTSPPSPPSPPSPSSPPSPPSPSFPPSPPSEQSTLCNATDSHPCATTSASSPVPPDPNNVTLLPSPSLPLPPVPPPAPPSALPSDPPSDPEPNINATNFWRSCNLAGCTQEILADFIHEMTDIFSRIQTDQASKEDYDRALSVMAASGRLAEFVAKQQEELQRKQRELQKAAEAMKEVVSALKK